jgi:hypothetical protein
MRIRNKRIKNADFVKMLLFLIIVLTIFFLNNNNKGTTKLINQDFNNNELILIEHLEGTCPRNRICSSPSCSLWSDINKDGICDRSDVEKENS